MKRLVSVLAVVALTFVLAGTTQAATFVPSQSSLTLNLGSIFVGGPNALPGTEGLVTLTPDGVGGHNVVLQPSVWSTVNYSGGTSLWTGIPLISDALIDVRNRAMSITPEFTYTNFLAVSTGGGQSQVGPGMGFGDPAGALSGSLFLSIFKGFTYATFTLTNMGNVAGVTQSRTVAGLATIPVIQGPYFTGPVPVTGITTNVLSWNGVSGAGITLHLTPEQHAPVFNTSIPPKFVSTAGQNPLEYHTVTIVGTNELLSVGRGGVIMIPSPMRIDTGPSVSGIVPGASWMTLTFVPEPGTLLLLAAGAVGLVVVGRRRARK